MGIFDSIFGNNSSSEKNNEFSFWKSLTTTDQINEIIEASKQKPVLIFKHSTRCSISRMVLSQFERSYDATDDELKSYYLDLLSHRDISNALAETFGVFHQSPQVLLIKNGVCVFNESHDSISFSEIKSML